MKHIVSSKFANNLISITVVIQDNSAKFKYQKYDCSIKFVTFTAVRTNKCLFKCVNNIQFTI